MTSPVERIFVECPKCGHAFIDWCRPSINTELDDFDEDYIREAMTATCPKCGHVIEL
ncbi:hypothetical protein P4B35_18365 [Pontiellaceae bacterium B12227]|nr:hypothetical protein [Pontiellaceae bacterium B12227]